jgi:hypothetical protein
MAKDDDKFYKEIFEHLKMSISTPQQKGQSFSFTMFAVLYSITEDEIYYYYYYINKNSFLLSYLYHCNPLLMIYLHITHLSLIHTNILWVQSNKFAYFFFF